ncbi:MAG: hypothetical protein QOH43_892 [Solirubrobacteraceae bacterium]|nr:hypothetical protein [Solirubrobacteraceae bacterium]
MAGARGCRGQATVELLALLPLVVGVALVAAQALALGRAHELAGHAAEAGAVALVQGGDARVAVRAAVPGWPRERVGIRVDGRRVTVELRATAVVPVPAAWLRARARADAGPAA